jgi:hypothetical protein
MPQAVRLSDEGKEGSMLQYRACGAERRDDYLRSVAHDNGLPLACVRKIADRLGEREDFGALVLICEERWGHVQ